MVVVGVLILSAAVNTSIIGSNGVLNRVAEDGVLSDWFREPQQPELRWDQTLDGARPYDEARASSYFTAAVDVVVGF